MEEKATFRVIGFVVSLLLTLVAYWIIVRPEFFRLGRGMDVMAILLLAVGQGVVQLIFFINVWRERGPRWNLGVFISTIAIVVIIVAFSIWIMHNLDYNMMPTHQKSNH